MRSGEAIDSANVRRPQGAIEDSVHRWQIQTNDELKTAAEYQPLIIHYNNGAAVRLATSPASPTRCRMSVTPG